MTVAIYIRVSTQEQAQEGYSIPAQKARLKAYCEAQGWNDYRFYIDAGVSAKDMEREQLQLMMQHVREEKINMILVYRLDRFTRSVRDLYEMLDMLDSHGCAFKSATEIYDTSNAMGRMFIGIVALLAQWERENIGERIGVALDERASDLKANGQPTYGYKIEDDYFVINEDEKETTNWLINNVLNGKPINALAFELNKRQIPTPRNRGSWHATTIRRILNNPALCGTYHYKDVYSEDAFEAYIDKDTFNKLQTKLADRAVEYVRGVSTDAVFHGVLRCPVCGHVLYPSAYHSMTDRSRRLGFIYRCQACERGRKYHRTYNERKLIAPFLTYLRSHEVTMNPKPSEEDSDIDQAEELTKQIDRIDNQRLKYQRAWGNDIMTDDEFEKLMQESKENLEDIKEELKNLPEVKKPIDPELIKSMVWTLRESFEYMEPMEQRNFISRFIRNINFRVENEHVEGLKKPRTTFHITDVEFY